MLKSLPALLIDIAPGNGVYQGAAGLIAVAAIAETAVPQKGFEFGEALRQFFFRILIQAELTDPR